MPRNDHRPNPKRFLPASKRWSKSKELNLTTHRINSRKAQKATTERNFAKRVPSKYRLHQAEPEYRFPRHRIDDAVQTQECQLHFCWVPQRPLDDVRLRWRLILPAFQPLWAIINRLNDPQHQDHLYHPHSFRSQSRDFGFHLLKKQTAQKIQPKR
jgi:hypothetical protein